jgi:hypothetical protein
MPQFNKPYEQRLWEGGEACIKVLHTTVEAEVQYGNPRNIPIDILCLYIYTCASQLEQLEMEEGSFEARCEKVEQLLAGIGFIKARKEPKGDEAIEYVLNELRDREKPMHLLPSRDVPIALGDFTYGGRLPYGRPAAVPTVEDCGSLVSDEPGSGSPVNNDGNEAEPPPE